MDTVVQKGQVLGKELGRARWCLRLAWLNNQYCGVSVVVSTACRSRQLCKELVSSETDAPSTVIEPSAFWCAHVVVLRQQRLHPHLLSNYGWVLISGKAASRLSCKLSFTSLVGTALHGLSVC